MVTYLCRWLFYLLLFVAVEWSAIVTRVYASERVGANVKHEWKSLVGSIRKKILAFDFDADIKRKLAVPNIGYTLLDCGGCDGIATGSFARLYQAYPLSLCDRGRSDHFRTNLFTKRDGHVEPMDYSYALAGIAYSEVNMRRPQSGISATQLKFSDGYERSIGDKKCALSSIGRFLSGAGRTFCDLNRSERIKPLLLGGVTQAGGLSEQSGSLVGENSSENYQQHVRELEFEKVLKCSLLMLDRSAVLWRRRAGFMFRVAASAGVLIGLERF